MYEEIEKLQNEVDTIATQIEEICKTDSEINDLYFGTQIYLSPLKSQMDLPSGSGDFPYHLKIYEKRKINWQFSLSLPFYANQGSPDAQNL